MKKHSFHIDNDTMEGLERIVHRFGPEMGGYIFQQWMVDHQMLPNKQPVQQEGYVELKSGILIKAQIFTQSHSFTGIPY